MRVWEAGRLVQPPAWKLCLNSETSAATGDTTRVLCWRDYYLIDDLSSRQCFMERCSGHGVVKSTYPLVLSVGHHQRARALVQQQAVRHQHRRATLVHLQDSET